VRRSRHGGLSTYISDIVEHFDVLSFPRQVIVDDAYGKTST
jgi:hypothetical protein